MRTVYSPYSGMNNENNNNENSWAIKKKLFFFSNPTKLVVSLNRKENINEIDQFRHKIIIF